MRRSCFPIILACALAILAPAASGGISAVNIFDNGDFEDPELGLHPSYTDRNFQPGLGGWISTGDRSSITPGLFDPGQFSALALGNAELRQDFYSFANDLVSIEEDLSASGAATFGGQVTHISFWAAHPTPPARNILVTLFYNDGNAPIQQFYQTITNGWELFDITAQHDPLRELAGISFFGTSGGRTFIDGVQVLVAIPEPGSVTLLLAAIGAVLFVRRRAGD